MKKNPAESLATSKVIKFYKSAVFLTCYELDVGYTL